MPRQQQHAFNAHEVLKQPSALQLERDKADIAQALGQLERAENITIVWATETGERESLMPASAAWHLPSERAYKTHFHIRYIYVNNSLSMAPVASLLASCESVAPPMQRQVGGYTLTGFEASDALRLAMQLDPLILLTLFSATVYKESESVCPFATRVRSFLEHNHGRLQGPLLTSYRAAFIDEFSSKVETPESGDKIKASDYLSALKALAMYEWLSLRHFSPAYATSVRLIETNLNDLISDLGWYNANKGSHQDAYDLILELASMTKNKAAMVDKKHEQRVVEDWLMNVLGESMQLIQSFSTASSEELYDEMRGDFGDILSSLSDTYLFTSKQE